MIRKGGHHMNFPDAWGWDPPDPSDVEQDGPEMTCPTCAGSGCEHCGRSGRVSLPDPRVGVREDRAA